MGGHLAAHIVSFACALRRLGLLVGSQQIADAATAANIVGLGRKEDVRQAFCCTFVCRNEDREVFDLAFDAYWRAHSRGFAFPGLTAVPPAPRPKQLSRVLDALGRSAHAEHGQGSRMPAPDATLTYSAEEALRKKDFAAFTPRELEEAVALLRRLRWKVGVMPVRRLRASPEGRRFHLQSTLRRNLGRGAEILEIGTRGPVERPRPIVVLCDISGSMERYSRVLLHFMHVVTCGFHRVESFVFGTRLTRLTRFLRVRDVDEALDVSAKAVRDWGGGTRIGECLKEFNFRWLRRVLRSSGVVVLISDGIDRGDQRLLADEMARLRRSCHRLMWLNPLLGFEGYQPLTRGMRAALPHVTDFLPVHNLDALEGLGVALGKLSSGTG